MVGSDVVVVWDVDGTLIPADLRWLRRAIARTYAIEEGDVVFPARRVHGYTDESIAVDTALCSGVSPQRAEAGIGHFRDVLTEGLNDGRDELAREQPPYPGAVESIEALHRQGYVQTVLTGNLKAAAEIKLDVAGLGGRLDLGIGGFGSDARDRFALPAVVARRFAARHARGLDPGRVVVIGDAPNDIACARHAGFHVVVVTHRTGRDELATHHPDAILDRLTPGDVVSTVASLVSRSSPPAAS